MKKFSKILCLVLVIVMMAGLCAVGTSAAYKDADKITYKEAVDVMSAIGVLQGDENGFRPADGLTRAEACKIITYMVGAEKLTATSTFKDTKGHWAESFIAYCAAEGFVNGVGNGKFDPNGALTGSAFAKMLLGALGYVADYEGMTGETWEVAVAKLVKDTRLAAGIAAFNGTATITREQAAQLALNTLTAQTVSYDKAGTTITAGSVTITTGASDAKKGDTFMATYFKNLGLTTAGADDLGRQANVWTLKKEGTTVGTYTNQVLAATYTAGIAPAAQKALAAEYKNFTKAEGYKIVGAITPKGVTTVAEDIIAQAGNGRTVEVYVTPADPTVVSSIVVIAPQLVEVAVTEKAATKTVGAYTEYKATGLTAAKVFSTVVDAKEDVTTAVVTGTVKDGDMALVYTGEKMTYITAVETVKGICTSTNSTGAIVIDGTTYRMAADAVEGTKVVAGKVPVAVYVDANGYIFGCDTTKAPDTYCVTIDQDETVTLENGKFVTTYTVKAVLTDGTVADFEVAKPVDAKLIGVACKYETVKGITTFTKLEKTSLTGITTKTAKLADGVYANAATTFVFVDYAKNAKTEEFEVAGTVTTYTGIANVPTFKGLNNAYAFDTSVKADGVAEIVVVFDNTKAVSVAEYVYLTGSFTTTADGTVYGAIVKGEETTVTSVADLKAGLYETVEATTAKKVGDAAGAMIQNNGNLLFVDGKCVEDVTIADTVAVYVIDTEDNTCTVKTGADLVKPLTADGIWYTVKAGAVQAVYALVH